LNEIAPPGQLGRSVANLMESYNALKQLVAPIFQRSGHKQIAKEIRPDAFGSAYSDFDNQHSKIRLVWDGKDGWGFAQLFTPGASTEWKDISCCLTSPDLDAPSQAKVDEFLAAIENVAM
jgi:hypothetical protein